MKEFRDVVLTLAALIWLVIGAAWLIVILTSATPDNGTCSAHYHMRWALGTDYCEANT